MAGFRTKARAVDLLGEMQIKDAATAITELFKNSHDADASTAVIDIDTKAGSMLLWDDGHGMTPDDVETKWLTIGTDSKFSRARSDVKRSPGGRVTMGEKGIGRLAVATLGSQTIMITKAKNGPFVMVYVHWAIFGNSRLFLEDTVIPVRTVSSLEVLDDLIADMKAEQRLNFESDNPRITAAWAGEEADTAARVLRENYQLHFQHENFECRLSELSERGHGTLFYVCGLKESWDKFGHPGQKSKRLRDKRDNLQVMMSSFLNVIQLFEGQTEDTPVSDAAGFQPKFLIDGREVVNPEAFDRQDLQCHDYGLFGVVQNGRFQGTATIQGRDPEVVDVDLTNGIDADEASDCGPYAVRIYIIEGDDFNSRLAGEVHDRMKEKLGRIGGLYVYRDGLRVLPYGPPEHDFLNIERRRSSDLGRYIFSLRNMFGYVAVSKQTNPWLQDKTNREGLRETPEYVFFRDTLQQLFMWWSTGFLNKQGRRKNFTEENNEQKAREKAATEALLQREKDLKTYLRALSNEVPRAIGLLERSSEELLVRIDERVPTKARLMAQVALTPKGRAGSYFALWGLHEILDDIKRDLSYSISKLGCDIHPRIDARFDANLQAVQALRPFADAVERHKGQLLQTLDNRYAQAKEYLGEQLQRYLDAVAQQVGTTQTTVFIQGLQQKITSTDQAITRAESEAHRVLTGAVDARKVKYQGTLEAFLSTVNFRRDEVVTRWAPGVKQLYEPMQAEAEKVRDLLDQFTDVSNATNLQALAREIQRRLGELSVSLSAAQDRLDLTTQQAVAEYTIPTLEVLDAGHDLADERRLVTLLEHGLFEAKRQLEGYRSLGATGLAAEVVNHEFEQQYDLIRNLFEKPHIRSLVNRTPDLERIEELLKQVEERHRLMSPLYRRTRMYKRDLILKDIGAKMADFFHAQIDLYNIDFQNKIDDDFKIRESEPILYPVFINIINNAVYWLLNRKERTILLWTDPAKGALYLEDSGRGIAPEDAEKIFELFYTTRVDGRGIGLHLVRELLSSRNHRVTCVTDKDEKKLDGACFRIQFEPSSLIVGGPSA